MKCCVLAPVRVLCSKSGNTSRGDRAMACSQQFRGWIVCLLEVCTTGGTKLLVAHHVVAPVGSTRALEISRSAHQPVACAKDQAPTV
jgi:hypothetical protein